MIANTMERLGFPSEAVASLQAACDRILAEPKAQVWIEQAKTLLFDGAEKEFLVPLEKLALVSDVDRRTSDMVFLLLCIELLKERYAAEGLPEELLFRNKDHCVRIPMRSTLRSLNLSNSVAIGVYEVLRQWNFPELENYGRLRDFDWSNAE